jgi:hypothetical protein
LWYHQAGTTDFGVGSINSSIKFSEEALVVDSYPFGVQAEYYLPIFEKIWCSSLALDYKWGNAEPFIRAWYSVKKKNLDITDVCFLNCSTYRQRENKTAWQVML